MAKYNTPCPDRKDRPKARVTAWIVVLSLVTVFALTAHYFFVAEQPDIKRASVDRGYSASMPRQVPVEAKRKSSKLMLYAVDRREKIGSEIYSCIVYFDSTVRCSSGERSYETRVRPN